MLGLMFTEFIEMVEDRFSAETADAMLSGVPTNHGGAYTAVGYYSHEDLVALMVQLSSLTSMRIPEILRTFGHHLAARFTQRYPTIFARHARLLDFLAAIDSEIHVEVRKLYPLATLPRFVVLEHGDTHMKLLYCSPRHLEALVTGLLEQLSAHYGQPCSIKQEPWAKGAEEGTLFNLKLEAA
jgi:hypothetical protein